MTQSDLARELGEPLQILDPEVRAATADLRRRFAAAKPFKHVVVDGFFVDSFARALLEQFPSADERPSANPYGAPGGKAFRSDLTSLGAAYRRAHASFGSPEMLRWLSGVTGIDDLVYDERNFGGGTHENFDGRDLRPHVDFNYHPVTKLHRRLNLIVYLNEDWRPEWGGAIALHSDPRDARDEVTEYAPDFNRCIIFETSERSWHGFERIDFPVDRRHRSRKSLSIYLYTRERPDGEARAEHTTFFIPRGLPSRFEEGRTLDASDVAELRELMGQRERLIELYQREQGGREADSAQAARLRILVAELQARREIPMQGYVRSAGEVTGRFADGWSGDELSFAIRAERPVRAVTIRARIPERVPAGALLRLEVGDAARAKVSATPGLVQVDCVAAVGAGGIAMVRLRASATVNHKRLGVNADERDLGFLLESATFEHDLEPVAFVQDLAANESVKETRAAAAASTPKRTYAVIGDSQSCRFDGLSFESRERPGERIAVKARWQPFARVSDVFADGRVSEFLTRVFVEFQFRYVQTKAPSETPFSPLWLPTTLERSEFAHFEPRADSEGAVVLFSLGEMDSWDINHELHGRYRIAVDTSIEGLDRLPDDDGDLPTISATAVIERIRERHAPLFEALESRSRPRRSTGISSLHELLPPG